MSNAAMFDVTIVTQMPSWSMCLKVEKHLHEIENAKTECKAEKL